MKKFQQIVKAPAGLIGIICLLATAFTSCVKNNNDDYVAPPAALVSVINASAGTQPVDFYLDQNRGSNYAIPFGQGQDYIRAYTGKRTFTFYVSGTQQKYKSDTTTLAADKFYTVYLTGTATQPDYLLLRDSIAQPASGKATIRLVNVSPDAPAVDLAIKQGAVLATSKAYKTASPFVVVDGNNTYTLEIRQAGTTTVLASITDAKLSSNSVYTVWLQGLSTATDNTKTSAKIQLNAYYY